MIVFTLKDLCKIFVSAGVFKWLQKDFCYL